MKEILADIMAGHDIKQFLMNNDYEMVYAENISDPEHGVLVYARL